jgi:pyruvate/oxaloacetate carboxyltransferase
MHPDDVVLTNTAKLFQYQIQVREIDACDDIKELRNSLKSVIKLFMKQQEVVASLGIEPLNQF